MDKSPAKLLPTHSLRSLASKSDETEEQRYKRMQEKYCKDLQKAIGRRDKLKKEKKVKSWMELHVLLNVNNIPTVAPPEKVQELQTPPPPQEHVQTYEPARRSSFITVSKSDRDACSKRLDEMLQSEEEKLREILKGPSKQLIKEQEETVLEIKRQKEELHEFEEIVEGKPVQFEVPDTLLMGEKQDDNVWLFASAGLSILLALLVAWYYRL